jgi:hypothetical protein
VAWFPCSLLRKVSCKDFRTFQELCSVHIRHVRVSEFMFEHIFYFHKTSNPFRCHDKILPHKRFTIPSLLWQTFHLSFCICHAVNAQQKMTITQKKFLPSSTIPSKVCIITKSLIYIICTSQREPQSCQVLKYSSSVFNRHSANSLFTECGHENTRRSPDTRQKAYLTSVRLWHSTPNRYSLSVLFVLTLGVHLFAECLALTPI